MEERGVFLSLRNGSDMESSPNQIKPPSCFTGWQERDKPRPTDGPQRARGVYGGLELDPDWFSLTVTSRLRMEGRVMRRIESCALNRTQRHSKRSRWTWGAVNRRFDDWGAWVGHRGEDALDDR